MSDVLRRHNVLIKGSGNDVMLFAHGFGCDQNAWRRITSAFENTHRIILFDFIGAGRSDTSGYDKEKYSSLSGYSDDIIQICNELEIKGAVFVGHSVSCMSGALASIKAPEIFRKLIFIGPSPCYLNDEEYQGGFGKEDIESLFEIMEDDYIKWSSVMAPKIMGDNKTAELKDELSDSFCSYDPLIAMDFARATFLSDNRKDLCKIPVESLTLQCSEDIIAPLQVGEFIRDNTPGNRLIVLKATGHCPHMSAPEETIAAINSFL
jgi:sigma-B regulation protein RsbQ